MREVDVTTVHSQVPTLSLKKVDNIALDGNTQMRALMILIITKTKGYYLL